MKTFEVWFLHSKVESIIDAWHIFKSSYDETTNLLIVSSYELLNICQASIVDESWYAKIILKILGENYKNIKMRKIWGVVLVGRLFYGSRSSNGGCSFYKTASWMWHKKPSLRSYRQYRTDKKMTELWLIVVNSVLFLSVW